MASRAICPERGLRRGGLLGAADLHVARLPPGPVGASRPFVGVDGWFVNARRPNGALAAKAALALSDRAAQRTMSRMAIHVPADALVVLADPLAAEFATAVAAGRARPTARAFEACWTPFRRAAEAVVIEGKDATAAVKTACSAMNAANGR